MLLHATLQKIIQEGLVFFLCEREQLALGVLQKHLMSERDSGV